MYLPVEILENILAKCDGKTLLNARKANETLKSIVDYLTKKTKIWEWCCREDIPNDELLEYLEKYEEKDVDKWLTIYINWSSWEDIDHIVYDIVLTPVELPRISCIAVSSNHIAVGSEDGRLRIYTKNWKLIFGNRIAAVKLTKLTFIEYHEYNENKELDLCLVVAFPKGLYIFCFDGIYRNQLDIHDVKSHSIFRNYICYEKLGGRMTIARLTNSNGRRELQEVWFTRIYTPRCITSFRMWNGICTFLINSYIKIINYQASEISPMEEIKEKAYIKFNFPLMIDSSNTQILRDNVIISLYKSGDELKGDFIEIILLGEGKRYSKKLFNTWEIFWSYITCVFLYGNTLLLGVDTGSVYFYHVSSWKNLDLRNYNERIIIGKHPIVSIAVKESGKERKFYVSSKFNIHEVSGFLPNAYA